MSKSDPIADLDTPEGRLRFNLGWLDFDLKSSGEVWEHTASAVAAEAGEILIGRGYPPPITPMLGAFTWFSWGCCGVPFEKIGEGRLRLFLEDMLLAVSGDRLEYAEEICNCLCGFYLLLQEIGAPIDAASKVRTIERVLRAIRREAKRFGVPPTTRH
jgi:hypothetical protein